MLSPSITTGYLLAGADDRGAVVVRLDGAEQLVDLVTTPGRLLTPEDFNVTRKRLQAMSECLSVRPRLAAAPNGLCGLGGGSSSSGRGGRKGGRNG